MDDEFVRSYPRVPDVDLLRAFDGMVLLPWQDRLVHAICKMFDVPPWLIGFGKRPPRPRSQRETGHHRKHRR